MEIQVSKDLDLGVKSFNANSPLVFAGDAEVKLIYRQKVKEFKIICFIHSNDVWQATNVRIDIKEDKVEIVVLLRAGFDVVYFRKDTIFLAYIRV